MLKDKNEIAKAKKWELKEECGNRKSDVTSLGRKLKEEEEAQKGERQSVDL